MKKILQIIVSVTILIFSYSCSKVEWIKDKFDGHLPSSPKSDYIQASPDKVMLQLDYSFIPYTFKKSYNSTGELREMRAGFRDLIVGGAVLEFIQLKITRLQNKLYVISTYGDTLVNMRLNEQGKPEYALAGKALVPFFGLSQFTFAYQAGRLTEIFDIDDNAPYVRIQYEAGRNNISKLLLGDGTENVSYTYDHSKKATGQYYPDEMRGNTMHFWALLKYLNLFEELQNENYLTSAYLDISAYPGDIRFTYRDHQLNSKGKLVAYKATEDYVDYPDLKNELVWTISWK